MIGVSDTQTNESRATQCGESLEVEIFVAVKDALTAFHEVSSSVEEQAAAFVREAAAFITGQEAEPCC